MHDYNKQYVYVNYFYSDISTILRGLSKKIYKVSKLLENHWPMSVCHIVECKTRKLYISRIKNYKKIVVDS